MKRTPAGKGSTTGKGTKPAARALDAKLEALSKDEQFVALMERLIVEYELRKAHGPDKRFEAALDRFVLEYELRSRPAAAAPEDEPALTKALSKWERGEPITQAERHKLEELGVLRPDAGPEPVEVGGPVIYPKPKVKAKVKAPVIQPHEAAELVAVLMSMATRLRTAAAHGDLNDKEVAGSLAPVLSQLATAVRLLSEFLNYDCGDNALLAPAVDAAKRAALSWPGCYYAQPAVQNREQKRHAKLANKLPLRMHGAKQPSVYALAAVDVLLAVQENILWLHRVQPGMASSSAETSALVKAIDDNEEHPLRLPVDARGNVEAPATWGTWRRLFDCVAVLRHGTEKDRAEAIYDLGVEEAEVPHWLRAVDAYANEVAAKTKHRGSRVVGEIREQMRNHFDAALFDMTRRPARATRRKH